MLSWIFLNKDRDLEYQHSLNAALYETSQGVLRMGGACTHSLFLYIIELIHLVFLLAFQRRESIG